jgi:hypothetical protein
MAYLRYYRYRGDPGFFGNILKGITKILPAAAGFIPGVGGVFGKVLGKVLPAAGKVAKSVGGVAGAIETIQAGPILGNPIVRGVAKAVGTGALFAGGSALAERVLKGGGGGGMAGGRRYKRMHVTNVKALRRAMRRVEGFAKLAKSTIQFTTHTRMKKRAKRR